MSSNDLRAVAASKPRVVFLMEQQLGHITHSQNLRRFLEAEAGALNTESTLWEIPGPPSFWNRIKPVRGDIMLRIAVDGYIALRSAKNRYDGAFLHTLAVAQFCGKTMARFPTVVSLDATPLQFKQLYFPNLTLPENLSLVQRAKIFVLQKSDLKRKLFLEALQNARHVVTWSEWAKQSVVSDYGVAPEKVTVIPPGIDLRTFRPDETARPNDGVTRILFVGGDFARKGGNLLLQWARERQNGETPWELHLVTPHKIEEALPPGVFVHANVTNNSPELVRLYQQSDVFALPTQADCTPLVSLEAQACGLPVVTTTVGGLPNAVVEAETGFLVAPTDAATFGAHLDSLINDAALRKRMGQSARARAEKHFDLTTNYARLVQVTLEASGKISGKA